MVSFRMRSRSVTVSVTFSGVGSACRCRTEFVGIVLKGWCGESEQINGTARKYPSCCEAQNGSHSGAGHQWNRLGICVDIRTVAL
ncbi:hypothetical protein B0H14DRAFT_3050325, partial [Mycena olivaceomarginata]